MRRYIDDSDSWLYEWKSSVGQKNNVIANARKGIVALECIKENWDTVRKLGHILMLDHYWADHPIGLNDQPRLSFAYCGRAKNQRDAREDLLGVIDVLDIDRGLRLTIDNYYSSYGEEGIEGTYEGIGRLGGQAVCVRVKVPWLLPGCTVEKSIYTTYARNETRYSVTCPRR